MDGASLLTAAAEAELDADVVRPGGMALLVVLGLAIATALLLRSMTKHLRRIDFDESAEPDSPAPQDSRSPDEPDK